MVTSYLLSLPPELRLRIYDFVVSNDPLTKPPSHYIGLVYCCREIRNEFEPELVKRMTACLLETQAKCRQVFKDDMQFAMPQTLNELYNLRVFRPDEKSMFKRSDPFLALMYMHFNTLTITTPLPSPSTNISSASQPAYNPNGSEAPRTPRRRCTRCMHLWKTRRLAIWISFQRRESGVPAAQRITYDWSAVEPEHKGSTGGWECEEVWVNPTDLWTLQLLSIDKDHAIGAAFTRKEKEESKGAVEPEEPEEPERQGRRSRFTERARRLLGRR